MKQSPLKSDRKYEAKGKIPFLLPSDAVFIATRCEWQVHYANNFRELRLKMEAEPEEWCKLGLETPLPSRVYELEMTESALDTYLPLLLKASGSRAIIDLKDSAGLDLNNYRVLKPSAWFD